MSALRCMVKKVGHRAEPCGGALVTWFDPIGRLLSRCPLCDRQAAQLCRTCPRKTPSINARFCKLCAVERKKLNDRKAERKPVRRAKVNAQRRKRYAENPDVRAQQLAKLKEWRKRNPDKLQAQAQRQYASKGPKYEAMLERKRAEYARRKARQQQTMELAA